MDNAELNIRDQLIEPLQTTVLLADLHLVLVYRVLEQMDQNIL